MSLSKLCSKGAKRSFVNALYLGMNIYRSFASTDNRSQADRLCENPFLSFRRNVASKKSKQKPRFLPTVEMTNALFTQSESLGTM